VVVVAVPFAIVVDMRGEQGVVAPRRGGSTVAIVPIGALISPTTILDWKDKTVYRCKRSQSVWTVRMKLSEDMYSAIKIVDRIAAPQRVQQQLIFIIVC
jgi:hypothetical protein